MSITAFIWIIGIMFTGGLYFHKTVYKDYGGNFILFVKIVFWWPFYLGQVVAKQLTEKENL